MVTSRNESSGGATDMGLCYPVPSRHSWEWRLGRLSLVVGLPPSAIYPFLAHLLFLYRCASTFLERQLLFSLGARLHYLLIYYTVLLYPKDNLSSVGFNLSVGEPILVIDLER